jgi:glutathione S-transferase
LKLYYSPGTCSLSAHIALLEAQMPFEAVLASTRTHKLPDGTDFHTINPKGYVPLLEFDDRTRLGEGPAIVQWIADQVPEKQLAPSPDSLDRYRLQEWLTFIGTELHKQVSPLVNPAMPEAAKALFRQKFVQRLAFVDRHLADRDHLLGARFSVADGYLYTVARWAAPLELDISHLTNLAAFMARVGARPAVQRALQAEGLSA